MATPCYPPPQPPINQVPSPRGLTPPPLPPKIPHYPSSGLPPLPPIPSKAKPNNNNSVNLNSNSNLTEQQGQIQGQTGQGSPQLNITKAKARAKALEIIPPVYQHSSSEQQTSAPTSPTNLNSPLASPLSPSSRTPTAQNSQLVNTTRTKEGEENTNNPYMKNRNEKGLKLNSIGEIMSTAKDKLGILSKSKKDEKNLDKENATKKTSSTTNPSCVRERKFNHKHNLKAKTFQNSRGCSSCKKFIIAATVGYVCSEPDCRMKIHKECLENERKKDPTINVLEEHSEMPSITTPIRVGHQHDFQPSRRLPGSCIVCCEHTTPLLFCSDCNNFVHEECLERLKFVKDYENQLKDLRERLMQQQTQNQSPPSQPSTTTAEGSSLITPRSATYQHNLQAGSYVINMRDIEIGRMLGSGACGVVYFGRLFGADIAVKVLNLNQEQREAAFKTFQHEVGIMMKLHHPNIVLLMGSSYDANHFLIVTEYSENGSLFDLLHKISSPKLTWPQRVQIAEHTALGMNWLHKQTPQILHRDLKTANILIDRNLVAKICDFGISKVFEPREKDTTFFGSPVYSSPECLLQLAYDEKVDCYSFSFVLWELITSQIPFDGMFTTFEQLVQAVVYENVRPTIPANCPQILGQLIWECWSGKPKKRPSFQTILDLRLFRRPDVCHPLNPII
eukprot:TRINITY_DN3588_c0_g1_i1.p1 TRINITY_DN3588_c0_g1~~TRINITY_DN3588_c0_g1_i1.p1  ORF type:complete len:675 (+),score=122.43 TRINITY_DN3588_c0_g1_i1:123-2147(+)